jgi:hypothetical protein
MYILSQLSLSSPILPPDSITFLAHERPLDPLHDRRASPSLPSTKLRALRRLQIKLGLTLRRMLRKRACRTRLLRRRSRVERIP